MKYGIRYTFTQICIIIGTLFFLFITFTNDFRQFFVKN